MDNGYKKQNENKQNKNTTQKTKKINNTDPTKNPGVIRGACEGSHPPCQPSLVKVMYVMNERQNFYVTEKDKFSFLEWIFGHGQRVCDDDCRIVVMYICKDETKSQPYLYTTEAGKFDKTCVTVLRTDTHHACVIKENSHSRYNMKAFPPNCLLIMKAIPLATNMYLF